MASSEVDWLLEQTPEVRRRIIAQLPAEARATLVEQIAWRVANPWLKYQGDPVRFLEEGLGEVAWSKQAEIMRSAVLNRRTVVPTTNAIGKSHIAARIVAYFVACHPIGSVKVITTASSFPQVKNVIWPHIRRLQKLHMPTLGYVNMTEWMLGDPIEAVVEGKKPPDDDEVGMQGAHKAHMLIIVDEAGGISPAFGRSLEALTMGPDTHLVVLGNPPINTEQTWFERIASSPNYNLIRVSYFDTPNYTGEHTGTCRSCPPGMEEHTVASHLVDQSWVDEITEEFGKDSAYYEARVLALFPHDSTSKALPMSWLEQAKKNEAIWEEGTQSIRLGVDVASDGGDEFVISKADGWRVTVEHCSRGAVNEDAVHVAGVIKEHILEAEKVHQARGLQTRVRVKIDSIGVGWGVVSLLQNWGREGVFRAEIVGVNVAESARDKVRFSNQRSEMWWNMRKLIQPDAEGGQAVWLDIETKELAQLNAPTYGNDSRGHVTIEKKADMKKRGVSSPDRAEAMLLAVFEPPGKATIVAPVGLAQANPWAALSVHR
jgi:hypothetical protein